MKFDPQLKEFYKRQQLLASRIDRGEADYIFIDPDGTVSDWIFVIIERPSGVVYGTQCCGTSCEERYVEGLLAPCGGIRVNPEEGHVTSAMLTAPFHPSSNQCSHGGAGDFPEEKLDELAGIVRSIPFWHHAKTNDCTRGSLELDRKRLYEIGEAWVPVKTALGRGVLLWKNCD